MVDAVSGSPAATDSGALGRARLAENFDTFLSLLTTQLKNQDPLSPMDSTQFTQQLVQMTGVEQQLLTNDLLKKLVSNTGSGIATAVSLIGKQVRADSADTALREGKAAWTYALDRNASDVKLEILDSKGRIVRTMAPTDNKAGEHSVTWDGKATDGAKAADGVYTLRVMAKDSSGSVVPNRVYADGVVTGVEQADGRTLLTINGAKVPWERVMNISQPEAEEEAPAPPPSGSTTTNPDDKTSPPAAA